MTMVDFSRPSRHSRLRRRIILINLAVFGFLIAGALAVQSSREGLVDERLTGVEEQARIVANTLAEYATDPQTHTLRVADAEPLLRQLIAPTRLRGRLYLPSGHLAVDGGSLPPLTMAPDWAADVR